MPVLLSTSSAMLLRGAPGRAGPEGQEQSVVVEGQGKEGELRLSRLPTQQASCDTLYLFIGVCGKILSLRAADQLKQFAGELQPGAVAGPCLLCSQVAVG